MAQGASTAANEAGASIRPLRGDALHPVIFAAADEAGIPRLGLLALAVAESERCSDAERWGRHTAEAAVALAAGNDFPTHAEVERSGEAGASYGKTDPFPAGDPRADELRARILARLDDRRWAGV